MMRPKQGGSYLRTPDGKLVPASDVKLTPEPAPAPSPDQAQRIAAPKPAGKSKPSKPE